MKPHAYFFAWYGTESSRPLPEFTLPEFGSALRHSPPPAITIHRRDGGLTFLNTANIVRKTRYPGAPEGASTLLMQDGEEVISRDTRADQHFSVRQVVL